MRQDTPFAPGLSVNGRPLRIGQLGYSQAIQSPPLRSCSLSLAEEEEGSGIEESTDAQDHQRHRGSGESIDAVTELGEESGNGDQVGGGQEHGSKVRLV